MSGGTAIAVSPDAQSVYAGSFNSQVVGYRRDAAGALTQISCAIESASPPVGCVTGNGIHRVSGLAVSPDGHNLYVVSTLAPQAIATFARLLHPRHDHRDRAASPRRQPTAAPPTPT